MAVLTNFTGVLQRNEVVNISDLQASGFETSLSGIPFTEQTTGSGFGALSGSDLVTSRSIVNTIDLISEGEIEGLVSGEHILSGQLGGTGYTSGDFISYGEFPENQLRSIYLNETPVVSEGSNGKNYYNFQNFKYAISDGDAVGITKNDNFLLESDALKTQKSKAINERLYGPEDEAGATSYPKNFRVLNTNLNSFEINVKIPALSYTKAGSLFTPDEQNQQVGSVISFLTQYRPLYKNGTSGPWLTDNSSDNTNVSGLISSPYLHTIKTTVNYDDELVTKDNLVGWEFQITRTTLDSINSFVQNQSFIDSTTEIFQTSLSYPNSAVIGSQFKAEYFSSIPNRAFDVKLLKVQVPSNYDPTHRRYDGDWDGTFKSKKYWTDNPAWIFYDLVTNKRYGLGKYIESMKIDKWSLYKIAQYCDVLVDDGNDGVEPRFSANVYINSREEAFKVLQDFASIFRGIVYYGLGTINAIQDSEREPVIQFTNANVEEGDFNYSSTAKKTRFSVAVVRYNDKENFYKPALEYVEDVDAIRKYGVRETEVTAFGCTSKAQAIRLGRWILHTNSFEQESVSFSAGMDSLLVRPGDLIRISDKNRGTNLLGGRALDINATGVTLDRAVALKGSTEYSLTLTNPTYFYDSEQLASDTDFDSADIQNLRKPQINKIDFITDPAGNPTTLGFSVGSGIIGSGIDGATYGTVIGFPNGSVPSAYNLETGLSWSLDDNVYEPEYYNVVNIQEEENTKYSVTATKHYTGKFAAIESGITFTPKDPDLAGTAAPPPNPTGISASLGSLTTNSKKITYSVGCPTNLGTTSYYEVYVKTGEAWGQSSDFVNPSVTKPIPKVGFKINTIPAVIGQTTLTADYIPSVNNTGYHFLVYAVNNGGVYSNNYASTSSAVDVTNHFPIRDVSISSLRLTSDSASNPEAAKNAGVNTVIHPSSKDQTFTWDVSFENGTPPIELDYRVTVREPLANSALTGTIRQTYTSKGRNFDFAFGRNADIAGGPYRHYDLAVEARDVVNGGYSTDSSSNPTEGYDIVEVNNLRPSGYWLTPRHYIERGSRPGPCQSYEDLCTEQLITSDGKIRILLRQFGAQFNDIVGGNIYLSAKPFSTGDFTYHTGAFGAHSPLGGLTGTPDNTRRRASLGLTESEYTEYQIIKIPFVDTVVYEDCVSSSCSSNGALINSNLIVATANFDTDHPLRFSFDKQLHMAVSFFDSYDYAVSGINPTTFNDGQWVGFARPFVDNRVTGDITDSLNRQLNQGLYTGDSSSASKNSSGIYEPVLTDQDYIANPSNVIPAPYFENTGDGLKRSRYTGFSGVTVHPSKFTSAAGLSPYHAWLRLNVNGQWEGNGIERVRMLTKKDIETYYNFNGFFEYSCQFRAYVLGGVEYPNRTASRSVCRFTQGQIDSNGNAVNFENNNLNENHTLTGLRVGVPLFWQSGTHPDYSGFNINDENITSYNETGAEVKLVDDPTITATRPLHGFRRFRVYFDEHNLPPENAPGALAAYSVIGMNAWNGKYANWPSGSTNDSLFYQREGTSIFSTDTVQTWLDPGDVFENIPGVWNHHPAGFGQGYGGLVKTQRYFDVHMGRLVDDSYLEEALFAVVATNDYSISLNTVDTDKAVWGAYDVAMAQTDAHYVHLFDGGYTGLGLTLSERQSLSGWYRE